MKALLLTTVAALAFSSAAMADTILATAKVDNVLVATNNSASGSLNVVNQSFGPVFTLNSLTVNSESVLAPPGVLSTNTFNVNSIGGNHTLVLDIVALGLSGPNALTSLLSTFSVSGLPSGWSIQEQTFINNVLLSTTPVFTGVSDSASEIQSAFLGNLFNAEAIYTITSSGVGNLNGGVDISVAAVPEPATWGMMLLGFLGLGAAFRKRLVTPLAA